MDLQKARAELEKLPKIKEALQFIDGFDGYKYHSMNNHSSADWLNGALYAWQAAKAVPEVLKKFCNEHKDPAWRGRLTEYDKGYSDCCIAVLEMIEAQEKIKNA